MLSEKNGRKDDVNQLSRCNLANHIALKSEMDLCFPSIILSLSFVCVVFCFESVFSDDMKKKRAHNVQISDKLLKEREVLTLCARATAVLLLLSKCAVNTSSSFHVATIILPLNYGSESNRFKLR